MNVWIDVSFELINFTFLHGKKKVMVQRGLITGTWSFWEAREGPWGRLVSELRLQWAVGEKSVLGRRNAYPKSLRQEDPPYGLGTKRLARTQGVRLGASRWNGPSQITQGAAGYIEDFTLYLQSNGMFRKILNSIRTWTDFV